METNVSLKQDLNFITKGLTFTGRFAFDTYADQNLYRTKSLICSMQNLNVTAMVTLS